VKNVSRASTSAISPPVSQTRSNSVAHKPKEELDERPTPSSCFSMPKPRRCSISRAQPVRQIFQLPERPMLARGNGRNGASTARNGAAGGWCIDDETLVTNELVD